MQIKTICMQHLILHIPHASENIPFKKGFVIDDTKIKEEILKLTDWFTDDLFSPHLFIQNVSKPCKLNVYGVFCFLSNSKIPNYYQAKRDLFGVLFKNLS